MIKKFFILLVAILMAAFVAVGVVACNDGGPAGGNGGPASGNEFVELESRMLAFQRAYAEIANNLNENETDSPEKTVKTKALAHMLSSSVCDELEESVLDSYSYKSSYSHTLGMWRNGLPNAILDAQLKPLVYAKFADAVGVDFLKNNMNYRNDGVYAITKAEDGYILEKSGDARDESWNLGEYSYSFVKGTEREDISFLNLTMSVNTSGKFSYLEASCFYKDCYFSLYVSFGEDGTDFSGGKPKDLSGEMSFSSLNEMRTYISSANPWVNDPVKGAYVEADEYAEAMEIYQRTSAAIFDCAKQMTTACGISAGATQARINSLRSDFIDMDEKTMEDGLDIGSEIRQYINDYTDRFYKNFSFELTAEEFYIEDGVLLEYLGTEDVVAIPEGVTKIADSCYLQGKKLFLPQSLETIEPYDHPSYKLANIKGFQSVYIPEENTNFYVDGAVVRNTSGKALFLLNNKMLERIDYGEFTAYDIRDFMSSVGKFEDDVSFDPEYVYGKLESVHEIIIDVSLFASSDFENYYPNLERLVLRDSQNVTEFELFTEGKFKNLQEIVFPDEIVSAVLYLGENTGIKLTTTCLKNLYVSSEKLMHIDIPDSVRSLELVTPALTKVELPTQIEQVNLSCDSLEVLELPQSVTKLALKSDRLTSLTIPQSVTEFGTVWCENLETLIFSGKRERIGRILSFIGSMPDGSLQPLREVVFPEGLISIEEDAFSNTSLRTLNFPSTLVNIDANAFSHCALLTSVNLPKSLRTIGEYAFRGCSSLFSVELPQGVERIGEEAFRGTSIKNLNVPASVKEAGDLLCADEMESITIAPSDNPLHVTVSKFASSIAIVENVTIPANVTEFNSSCPINMLTVYGAPKIQAYSARNILFKDMLEIDYPQYLETSGSKISSSTVVAFKVPTELYTVTYKNDDGSVIKTEQAFEGTKLTPSRTAQSSHADTAEQMYKFVGWILNGENVYGQEIIVRGDITLTAKYELTETFDWEETTDGVRILGYADATYNPSEMIIPAQLYGKRVTEIAFGAFAQCANVEKITLPFIGSKEGGDLYEIFGEYGSTPASLKEVILTATDIAGGFFGNSNVHKITYESTVTEIADNAFFGCSVLEELIFADNRAQTIGVSAFERSAVQQFTVPVTVRFIGANAFWNTEYMQTEYEGSAAAWVLVELGNEYSNPFYYTGKFKANGETVTELNLPSTVTQINAYAFFNCTSLVRVTVPNSVLSIGEGAFGGCENLQSITLPFVGREKDGTKDTHLGFIFGEIVILPSGYSYYESDNEQYVPASLKKVKVTGDSFVSARAFEFCKNLTEIVLAEGIRSIGESAFANSGLVRMTIPKSVTSMGQGAFSECNSLQYLKLPYSGTGSFVQNSSSNNFFDLFGNGTPLSLAELEIYGVEEVDLSKISRFDQSSFAIVRLCAQITKIIYPSYNQWLIPELYFEGTLADWASIQFENDDNMPIAEKLYIDGKLVQGDLIIPDGVSSISEKAFFGMTEITSLTIPQSVKSIGYGAFGGCSGIQNIYFNAENCAAEYCFGGGSVGIYGQVVIGSRVKSLCDNLFMGITVTSVSFEQGSVCESIGAYNFYGAVFETLSLPENLNEIGAYAFSDCMNLTDIVVPEGVTMIGERAFFSCGSLRSVYIPATAQVGTDILYACYSLQTVQIPADVLEQNSFYDEGVTELRIVRGDVVQSSLMFSSLKKLSVLKDVAYIDFSAFNFASQLTEIYFDARDYVCSNGFYGSSQYSVTVGPNVTHISDGMFGGDGLISVAFEEGSICTDIGTMAFASENLESIELPESIQTIGMQAFGSYGRVTDIYYKGDVKGWSELLCHENFHGYDISYNLYIQGELADELVIPETVTNIENFAFSGIISLTSVEFLSSDIQIGQNAFAGCASLRLVCGGVASVGNYAFDNCTALEEVKLSSEELLAVEGFAFRGCTALESLFLPQSVQVIGERAFEGCSSLLALDLPESLVEIGTYAFSNCLNVRSLTIHEKVEKIGLNAFSGMEALAELNFNATRCNDFAVGNGIFDKAGTGGAGVAVTIGANVEYIPAFFLDPHAYSMTDHTNDTNITSIVFAPGNVCTEIGNNAFAYCRVTEVILPDTVTKTGQWIYAGCPVIERAYLPEMEYVSEYVSHNAAYYFGYTIPQTLEEVWVMGGTYITERAFESSSVKIVHLAESITDLRDNAFTSCTSLEQVLSDGVILSVGDGVFAHCRALTVFDTSKCVTIGGSAFSNCVSMSSFDLSSLIRADSFAFNSIAAANIYVKDLSQWCKISFSTKESNPLYFGAGLYVGGTLLENIDQRYDLESVSKYAFYGYKYLANIDLQSVGDIGYAAFSQCASLINVRIGAAGNIGNDVFSYSESLETVNILTAAEIGNNVFHDCSSLKQVYMPDATALGYATFSGCDSLVDATVPFLSAEPGINIKLGDLFGCSDNLSIPQTFKSVSITGGYISSDTFKDCIYLHTVKLPFDVEYSLYDYTELFYGCGSLIEVRAPYDMLKYIPADITILTVTGGEIEKMDLTKFAGLGNLFLNVTAVDSLVCNEGLEILTIGSKVTCLGSGVLSSNYNISFEMLSGWKVYESEISSVGITVMPEPEKLDELLQKYSGYIWRRDMYYRF